MVEHIHRREIIHDDASASWIIALAVVILLMILLAFVWNQGMGPFSAPQETTEQETQEGSLFEGGVNVDVPDNTTPAPTNSGY